MLTRSAHAAQIAAQQLAQQPTLHLAQQPVQQPTNAHQSTGLLAQADGDRRVRWASRDQFFSPPPEQLEQPAQDGDSEMGDSEHIPPETGRDDDAGTMDGGSHTKTVHSDDGDTVMGDDSVPDLCDVSGGPQTPTRTGTYNYGSVILTPDKNKARASGNSQTVANDATKVHSRFPSLNGNFNRNNAVVAPTPTRARKGHPYVLVPTPPRRRQGRPARNENVAGPSNRPSTPPSRQDPPPANIQRRKMQLPSDTSMSLGPLSMLKEPVRWYHNKRGEFVRDGSLPPEYYAADQLRMIQPRRADTPPPEATTYVRADTEPLEDYPGPPLPSRNEEPALPPNLQPPKRKTKAERMAEIDLTALRRSVRIREQKK
ncbi:hypothetical protein V8D89_004433 [Ganoderma adspersum]